MDSKDESFTRKFTLPVEDRRANPYWPQWTGGHRWFRSANVVDLMNYRGQAEKERIYVNLLHHPARIYQRVKSA